MIWYSVGLGCVGAGQYIDGGLDVLLFFMMEIQVS